jgi:hypothetical protein
MVERAKERRRYDSLCAQVLFTLLEYALTCLPPADSIDSLCAQVRNIEQLQGKLAQDVALMNDHMTILKQSPGYAKFQEQVDARMIQTVDGGFIDGAGDVNDDFDATLQATKEEMAGFEQGGELSFEDMLAEAKAEGDPFKAEQRKEEGDFGDAEPTRSIFELLTGGVTVDHNN